MILNEQMKKKIWMENTYNSLHMNQQGKEQENTNKK